MKYFDGQEIHIWDRVSVSEGNFGIVVISVDGDEYSPQFPRATWQHLTRGVMIDTEGGGLIHYYSPDAELRLLSRGGPLRDVEWAEPPRESRRLV